MKQQIAVGIIAVALVGGTGTGFAVREMRADASGDRSTTGSQATRSTPTPTPTEKTSQPAASGGGGGGGAPAATKTPAAPQVLPLGSLQITPGAVGPVTVGMTQAQAVATGYFDADVPNEACGAVTPLAWTSSYAAALDVFTRSGAISSLGVRAVGPRTRSGLQVGSTWADVRAVVGDGVVPEEAGYGQTGVFVNDGAGWIGFLFDTTTDQLVDGDPVTFIEVTRGRKPALMRDGC